jgi:very-short-patch-repair endonuclease
MPKRVLSYDGKLKSPSRGLRKNMTKSEQALWSRLRGKQLLGVQFYRQKPLGNYIVDFFAPKVKLVVEVDGSQHLEETNSVKDNERDDYLDSLGICVVRFDSRKVLKDTDSVVDFIFSTMQERLK